MRNFSQSAKGDTSSGEDLTQTSTLDQNEAAESKTQRQSQNLVKNTKTNKIIINLNNKQS